MKYVVFDFDGTLADSLPIVLDIAEQIVGYGITKKEVEHYRNMTAKQIIKESGIPLYKVPAMLVKGKSLMLRRADQIQIFTGLLDVVADLSSSNYRLIVVSSNNTGIINGFLQKYGIDKYFSGVYGNVGLFSKAQALRRVMKREGFVASDAIYVGDEVRDIEASKKAGMPVIAVTWGYNGKKILTKYKPDYLVETPAEISNILSNGN